MKRPELDGLGQMRVPEVVLNCTQFSGLKSGKKEKRRSKDEKYEKEEKEKEKKFQNKNSKV